MTKLSQKKQEAREILDNELHRLKLMPYEELKQFLGPEGVVVQCIQGKSETEYTVEIEGIWDDEEHGHLRIMVGIAWGCLRSYFPMSDDFIISPDGNFVDEEI